MADATIIAQEIITWHGNSDLPIVIKLTLFAIVAGFTIAHWISRSDCALPMAITIAFTNIARALCAGETFRAFAPRISCITQSQK